VRKSFSPYQLHRIRRALEKEREREKLEGGGREDEFRKRFRAKARPCCGGGK